MKVKFADKVYEVLYTMKVLGKPIYAVEDEPNHIDWLVNVEVIDEEEESEDEETRKEIIGFLRRKFGSSCSPTPSKNTLVNWIAWLEKQGEHANFRNKIQIGDEVTRNEDGVLVNLSQLKRVAKKDEQKPIDKVESIFEVGNWVVANEKKYTFLVLVKKGALRYQVEDTNGDIYSFYLLPNGEEEYHIWTIEDAKDGDVLVASDGSIFIYKCQRDNGAVHYIAVTSCNDLEINKNDYCWECKFMCHPATKDERTILFERIKEAGYKWNADKKELVEL